MTKLKTLALSRRARNSSMDGGDDGGAAEDRGRGGERPKKRKADPPADRGAISEEDCKVEEFFALVRSTREARDRLLSTSAAAAGDHYRDRIAIDKPAGIWNPTFRPEDFLHDRRDCGPSDRREDHALGVIGGGTSRVVSPAKVEEEIVAQKEEEEDKVGNVNDNDNANLDLKLSL